jgi:hypothetical protein
MSTRACARERRERRGNATALPLDVCHHVCMYMCECMYVRMCVRVDSMHVHVRACVHVRARARRKRHSRAPHTSTYICTSTCICMSVHVDAMGACACVRARAHARECGMPICRNVRRYRRLFIQAFTDAQMHTQRHIGSSIYVCLQPRSSCMRVRMELYIRCRRLGMDRRASVCMYMYMYGYI